LQPANPKYAYTLAFCLHKKGDVDEALRILQATVKGNPPYAPVYELLVGIYEETGRLKEARAVCRSAVANETLPPADQLRFHARLQTLQNR